MSVGGMRGTEMLDVIEALKSAAAAATPGPWWSEGSNIYHDGRYLQCCGRGTIHGCCGDPEVAGHEQESVASAEEKDAEFIALARTAVPALIARLEAAEANLKWEQHRAGRIGTHSEDCHTWGPQHYECLLRKFNEAEARNATAYAEGVEAAAKAVEAYKRDASFDDSQVGALEHNSNEENIVCAIRSLLKDKPNEKTRQIAPPGQSTGE